MKKIAIGTSDFKKLIQNNYLFVDKSELIKEFWESEGETVLMPRPRRFGKTLNMSMIKYFFTNGAEQEDIAENRKLFKGLNIEKHEDIMALCGKYPVIYLSFKDEKHSSFENLSEGIRSIISTLFDDHKYCMNKQDFSQKDEKYYMAIINEETSLVKLSESIKLLSKYISNYYNQKVIILIDEYDVPIQAAYMYGYYDEAIGFMRNLLSGAFKDNSYLEKAMITGILRVSKESIFSGLNNIEVASILSYEFSDKFGFTDGEVQVLLEMYNSSESIDAVRDWYNGYYFGDETIYNPWSILKYLKSQREGLKAHWVNTSSNDLVNVLLSRGDFQVKQDLESLIKGEGIIKAVDENIVMADIEKSSEHLWSFLLFTGYLKSKVIPKNPEDEKIYYELRIPNREVRSLYSSIIERWYNDTISRESYTVMLKALLSGDIETFEEIFRDYVMESLSYFDVTKGESEKVYHAFVLGMLVSISDKYEVLSNRESGYGRYDVCIIPKDISKQATIIEFKRVLPSNSKTLETAAAEALKQIEDQKYATTLESRGITNILKLAIVFKGKEVYIKYD